jgi:hypothetical protein
VYHPKRLSCSRSLQEITGLSKLSCRKVGLSTESRIRSIAFRPIDGVVWSLCDLLVLGVLIDEENFARPGSEFRPGWLGKLAHSFAG